jgi:hypothetical protein
MHKLIEYICDELEEIERKAGKGGKLSMQELQYVDTLAHAKKNLMKCEEMEDGSESYSMRGYSRRMSYDDGGSYDGHGSYDNDGSYADGNIPGHGYRMRRRGDEITGSVSEGNRLLEASGILLQQAHTV